MATTALDPRFSPSVATGSSKRWTVVFLPRPSKVLATRLRNKQREPAHETAAQACEKAIEAIRTNRETPNADNDWAEVLAVDAAWDATETAWRRSREAG